MSGMFFVLSSIFGVLAALLGFPQCWEDSQQKRRCMIIEICNNIINTQGKNKERIVFIVANVVTSVLVALLLYIINTTVPSPEKYLITFVAAIGFIVVPIINVLLVLKGVSMEERRSYESKRIAKNVIGFFVALVITLITMGYKLSNNITTFLLIATAILGIVTLYNILRAFDVIANYYVMLIVEQIKILPDVILSTIQMYLSKCIRTQRDPIANLALGFT